MCVDTFQALLHFVCVTPGEGSHLEIFQDGQFGEQFAAFGDVGNTHADHLLRRATND
jgi:hypothetical protein